VKRLLISVVLLVGSVVCAAAVELSSDVYVKRDNWPDTMLATADKFVEFERKLGKIDKESRYHNLSGNQEWHILRGEIMPPQDGKTVLDSEYIWEKQTSFALPALPEMPNQSWRNYSQGQEMGRVLWLAPLTREKGKEYPQYMASYFFARETFVLPIWIGSSRPFEIFVNAVNVFSCPAPGKIDIENIAPKIDLPLKKGRNFVMIKFAGTSDRIDYYITYRPLVGAYETEKVVEDIKHAVYEDYPGEILSFCNIFGYDIEEWLRGDKDDRLAAVLKTKLLVPAGKRMEKTVQLCDKHLLLPPGERRQAIIKLVGSVLEQERERTKTRKLSLVAFIKRNGYGIRGTNATMFGKRTGKGSAICVYDPRHPEKPAKTIFETKEGFILDIRPSYDGDRLVMSYKEDNNSSFHVWEIKVDGTGLRQITKGPYHDFNPVYYPDGRIVFASSRVESYSLCQNFLACALHICNGDGSNIRRIDFTTLSTVTPSIMPDGSIICSRWEYQDKNIFSWQGLWTINPNGRQLKLYYGNTITVPNALYGPKHIPGTSKVMFTMATHHHVTLADIAVVERSHGLENPEGIQQLTHATTYKVAQGKNWRHINWRPGDKFFEKSYVDPMPVDEHYTLVSCGDNKAGRHDLHVMTTNGLVFPLYSDEKQGCFSAVSVSKRERPNIITGEVPVEAGEGTFFVQDIYQGLLEKGVKRGEVKDLRIIVPTPKKWNTEGPRYHDHYPIAGHGSYYIKDNLGTVPVHEDGTVYFNAPSHVELYFIALDKDGKEIQRMGSVTQITTGEKVSCIGCHENRLNAPRPSRDSFKRLQQQPDKIRPEPWGSGPFDYVKHVQPVMDKYCVKCHEGRSPDGGIDLSGDKTRFFNMSFEFLTREKWVDYFYILLGPTGVFPAKGTGSYVSKLTKLIEDKHGKHDVDIDDEGRRSIYAWIDSNVQYYNTWDMSRPYTTGGRDTWSYVENDKRDKIIMMPWMKELSDIHVKNCCKCHNQLLTGLGGRGHLTKENSWVNQTRPENSRILNAHLSEDAGGMGIQKKKKGSKPPLFKNTDDPLYRSMLQAIQKGKAALDARPRMDMPGGIAIPQQRDFAKVF